MSDTRQNIAYETFEELGRQIDDELINQINSRLPVPWSLEDIRDRVKIVVRPGYNQPELFCFDGSPMFELGPLERHSYEKDGRWHERITRYVKRFPPPDALAEKG
jgi:hypothetical protein